MAQMEWVSVEDGLPEEYESVLVFDGDLRDVAEYGFLSDDGDWSVYDPHREFGLRNTTKVTHWMPLPPEPPKE